MCWWSSIGWWPFPAPLSSSISPLTLSHWRANAWSHPLSIYLFAHRVASRGLGVRRRTVHTVYAKATGPRGASVSSVRRGTKRRQARALLGGLALGPTLMDGLACMARAHLRPPGLQANTAPAQLARCTEQLCQQSSSRGAMGHSTTRTPHRSHATVLGLELNESTSPKVPAHPRVERTW